MHRKFYPHPWNRISLKNVTRKVDYLLNFTFTSAFLEAVSSKCFIHTHGGFNKPNIVSNFFPKPTFPYALAKYPSALVYPNVILKCVGFSKT